jgi:hypothetical protein
MPPLPGTPGVTVFSPTIGDVFIPISPSGEITTNYLVVDQGIKTATAVAGAASLTKMSGTITTESLATAAGAEYTLTLTNGDVGAPDIAVASVENGTNTGGIPVVATVKTAFNQIVVDVHNVGATAFNGTLLISFVVFKNA